MKSQNNQSESKECFNNQISTSLLYANRTIEDSEKNISIYYSDETSVICLSDESEVSIDIESEKETYRIEKLIL